MILKFDKVLKVFVIIILYIIIGNLNFVNFVFKLCVSFFNIGEFGRKILFSKYYSYYNLVNIYFFKCNCYCRCCIYLLNREFKDNIFETVCKLFLVWLYLMFIVKIK